MWMVRRSRGIYGGQAENDLRALSRLIDLKVTWMQPVDLRKTVSPRFLIGKPAFYAALVAEIPTDWHVMVRSLLTVGLVVSGN